MQQIVGLLKALLIGAIAGCVASGLCEALVAGIAFVILGFTEGRVAEGVMGGIASGFYFFIRGAMEGARVGAIVGPLGWLISAGSWVRAIIGVATGGVIGAIFLKLANTVNAGEIRPPALVVAIAASGAIAAGLASSLVAVRRIAPRRSAGTKASERG